MQMEINGMYYFRKRSNFERIIPIFLMLIWMSFLFYISAANAIIIISSILLLTVVFNSYLEELKLSDDVISIRGGLNLNYTFKYKDILVFSGPRLSGFFRSSSFSIIAFKYKVIPLCFTRRGVLSEEVHELLEVLEEKTGKKEGVLFETKRNKQ